MRGRRISLIAAALVLCVTTGTAAYGASVPPDVAEKPYEEAVTALVQKGIITGDEKGLFNPDQTLTRAQACIIVVKSMQPPVAEVAGTATQAYLKSGFPDMSGYSWAEGYIGYAIKKGVTKGYPDGSFKPGNKVTSSELVTMILRAGGYFDTELGGTWPDNYILKANELTLYEGLPESESMPPLATKWMAAQMAYNALSMIEATITLPDVPTVGVPKTLPDFSGAQFVFAGSFDSDMTAYGGKTFHSDATIYTYGSEESYIPGMTFSAINNDYRFESRYKYKRVITPAYYLLEDDKIKTLVLPEDVGYTGTAYSVVNGTVNGLQTLTASRPMTWAYEPGVRPMANAKEYLNGNLYKLALLNGKIQETELAVDLLGGFAPIEEYRPNGPVKVVFREEGQWMEISDSATVYVLKSGNPAAYRSGTIADILPGRSIKLFHLSQDEMPRADVVIIKE